MSNNQKRLPGGHYSGNNPIPNIQRFIDSMDAEKKNRDAKINEEMKANKARNDVKDHADLQPTGVKGTRKTVTDPTTGKNVQIGDVNADFLKAVRDPQVN